MTNPLNTDAVKSEERAAFEAACQKLASMPEEAHEKLFGNDDLDTWWALWKEARASSTITSPKAVNSGQTEREALLADYIELNMSNYGPDDVDRLNAWAIEAYDFIARAASTATATGDREIWEYSFIHSSALGRPDEKVTLLTYDKDTAFKSTCFDQKLVCSAGVAIAEVCQDADGFKHIAEIVEELDDIPAGTRLYAYSVAAASPAPASPSGEDAAEQADAPVAPTFDDLAKRFGLEEMLSDVGAYGYDRTAMRKIVRDFYDALIALPRASEPPYSAPFTTDVPQCCGDPDTCNDPCSPRASEQADEADFKNFHRLLCERFGYMHDEADWKRDQLSLIEHIASKQTIDAGRYSRFRRWHPRLQTSYWTGQWWEPIYGEKMDACIDGLDEVPQPTPHADQSAARAKEPK